MSNDQDTAHTLQTTAQFSQTFRVDLGTRRMHADDRKRVVATGNV